MSSVEKKCKGSVPVLDSIMMNLKLVKNDIDEMKQINQELQINENERNLFYQKIEDKLSVTSTRIAQRANSNRSIRTLARAKPRKQTTSISPNTNTKRSTVNVTYSKTPIKPIIHRKETVIVSHILSIPTSPKTNLFFSHP